MLKRELVVVDRKEVAYIRKDGGDGRTKTNHNTGKKRGAGNKTERNMVEHEEFNFSAESQRKLRL